MEVTAAHYIDQFRVQIRFNNGEEGVVDLADALWGPMFEPLNDPAVFRRFEVPQTIRAEGESLPDPGPCNDAEQHAGQIVPDVLTLSHAAPSSPERPPEGTVAVAERPLKVSVRKMPDPSATHVRTRRTLAIRHTSGHRLVAMIEIASPANKDRAATVRSFVDKAVSGLQKGIHLLVADLFPPGVADPNGMHGAIWDDLYGVPYEVPADKPLTLASYTAGVMPQAYVEPLAVGMPLPDMPLFLSPEWYLLVPLEPAYARAYQGLSPFWQDVIEGRRASP